MRWNKMFTVVNCHAEGEVGQVLTGGVFDVPGSTMLEKMIHLEENRDDIRRLCIFEPRGSVNQTVNIVLPATDPRAQMGYVIAETIEYPVMSGSNTICVATVLLETGILPMHEPVTNLVLEAPAGLISLRCECSDGKVTKVEFTNQPAFVHHRDKMVEVEKLGTVKVDVAYGGMTFVLTDAKSLGFSIAADEARDLCTLGQRIKYAAAEQLSVTHPVNPLIHGITMLQFTLPARREGGVLTARNTCVVTPGRVDRSPCGTGTSARLALMHARGEIAVGEKFVHESIIGSRFESRIESLTKVGPLDAVVPVVSGQAWISGILQVGLDPTDPYPRGFTISDSWSEVVDDKLVKTRG